MKVVVGEILPLALVVAISPINVIPVILLLFTRRTWSMHCASSPGSLPVSLPCSLPSLPLQKLSICLLALVARPGWPF